MDDHTADPTPDDLTYWGRHRFLLLIALTIVIAFFIVGVAMALYATSGAAQLDLSRPGYRAVSSQAVTNDSDFKNYSSTGNIDATSISEFKLLYEKQALKAKSVDAFGSDPLNPDALEISAQAQPTQ